MKLQAFIEAFSRVAYTSLSNPAAVLVLSFFLNPALFLDGDARSSLYSGLVRFRVQMSTSPADDKETTVA